MPNIIGRKWGSSELGTAGGTVTWSLAGAGEDISRFSVGSGLSTTGDTFLDYDYAQVIADAFAEWSKHGDIEFEQVEDGGGAAGASHDADIRIFFGAIPGGTAGFAFYPSAFGSAIAGDILLDTISKFNTDPVLFFNLVLHEIGHALGLGHVSSNSIMTPTVKKIGLQPDDIDGIIQIYGAQDDPVPAPAPDPEPTPDPQPDPDPQPEPEPDPQPEPEPDPQPEPEPQPDPEEDHEHDHDHDHDHSHDPDSDHDHDHDHEEEPVIPTIEGNANGNRLVGTEGIDVIDGAGGNDAIFGMAEADILMGGEGHDTVSGGDGNDMIHGDAGNDRLTGNNGADTVDGGAGADKVGGGRGFDMLLGGSGKDTLKGGFGDDILDGGTDRDKLKGGSGVDTFIFADGHGKDDILDFDTASDLEQIDFSGLSTINSFDDVLDAISIRHGKHVMIDTGEDSWVQLRNTSLEGLDAGDFIF